MDLALVLLVLWALLFLPIGLAVHGLVLGAAARDRALPLAPITGIALALLALSLLARMGFDAGDSWVAWSFVVAAIACGVVVWRCKLPWRSRELIASSLLLLLAVLLVQLPVVGASGDGPLGYGTAANPVEEVASIDAAVGGSAADRDVARNARSAAKDRPVAFEQFAALTVAIGSSDSDNDNDASWSAYSLHAPITGMLAALVALPLFAFARARGVRWFGLVFLVPVGVLAPYTFLGLANGSGAAIATVPLLAAAVFSLLVTRRDRGWWSLAMLFGSAIAVTGGALAVLPLLTIGIAWMLLRATTYEHLAQADVPLGRVRALAPGVVAAVMACIGVVTTLSSGELLAWPKLHATVFNAARSWPFAWLDTDLSTAGPTSGVETAIWLAGPALLIIAAIHGVIRNERRELAVLIGAVAAAGAGLLATTFERDAGIRLYEYSILVVSPLLAALAVRGVALARENAESSESRSRLARIAGWGPVLLAVGFVLLSLASTSVTGSRMVHAPALESASIESGTAIVAGGDPWLAFRVDGERVPGGFADADALTTRRTPTGLPLAPWDTVVLANSPLGSDPTSRFAEDEALDSYQARLFYDRRQHPDAGQSQVIRGELNAQINYTAVAERNENKRAGSSDSEQVAAEAEAATAKDPKPAVPLVHTPVEGANTSISPDRPAGLLLPEGDVPGCGIDDKAQVETSRCEPRSPVLGTDCTRQDVRAARSPLAVSGAAKTRNADLPEAVPAGSGVLTVAADPSAGRLPTLIGVQCFDVAIEADARVLQLHLRNIGLILAPEDARASGPKGAWETVSSSGGGGVDGGVLRRTATSNAALSYGGGRISGPSFDITAEGSFGAGVTLESDVGASVITGAPTDAQSSGGAALDELRGTANGFGMVVRGQLLNGSAVLRNSSGTDVEFGRLFARPRDIPPSCDVLMGIKTGEQRELRIESVDNVTNDPIQRPGVTVTVVEAQGSKLNRTARVVVGSYLAYAGLPRYLLVDWTEQFGTPASARGCDGEIHTERGTDPPDGASLALQAGDDIVDSLGTAKP